MKPTVIELTAAHRLLSYLRDAQAWVVKDHVARSKGFDAGPPPVAMVEMDGVDLAWLLLVGSAFFRFTHRAAGRAEFDAAWSSRECTPAAAMFAMKFAFELGLNQSHLVEGLGRRINGRRGGRVAKNPHKDEALKLYDSLRASCASDSQCFAKVVAELQRARNDAPTAKTVREWVKARHELAPGSS